MGCSQSLSVMRLKWEEGEGLAGWAGGSDEEEDVGGSGRHDEIVALVVREGLG